ncbi:sensor domain-containing diguanylate cyclase [Bacillus massiliigorillae]|uniref:sensor domain-containing diguanylate cyclase n=1 Tax=Bacillus massiliigorillae TaxID=1243664 RepID=UPI0003A610D3|nr:diguanylate cyclase [Bacillus massiliigorillae]
MKNNTLLRTNIIVCFIITIGFIITSIISYRSNFGLYERDIEHVTTLATDGIYSQIDSVFSQPVHVSLTMANDSLLKSFLADEERRLNSEAYVDKLRDYLNAYKEKYTYDSVFLVSTKTNRYYHFNGIDRALTKGNPENVWYYDFLNNDEEYSLNIDNDEASNDIITVFVNCKIKDNDGSIIGIVGVGVKVNYLQDILNDYDKKFNIGASLVNENGVVEVTTKGEDFEKNNIFKAKQYSGLKDKMFQTNTDKQMYWYSSGQNEDFIVTQYIPNLKWHLVVENDTSDLEKQFQEQLLRGVLIIIVIIVFVLVIITRLIKKYNAQIVKLTLSEEVEYQKLLHQATEGLYDTIYEFDITRNKAGGESTELYFNRLGIKKGASIDEALIEIAHKQIKEEYIQGYLDTFLTANVLKAYNNGINNLTYDLLFGSREDGYQWMRVKARIFYWNSDKSVRMISFRKNIDAEKKREMQLIEESYKDSLTGLYNKRTTEDLINKLLENQEEKKGYYAFLLLDIDNFKNINDSFGHAYGDQVIQEFADELRIKFQEKDIVGRIGGDEFAVMMCEYSSRDNIISKIERLCTKLSEKQYGNKQNFSVTASIGVALFPQHGCSYSELYEKSDQALYFSKSHGKNAYTIFKENSMESDCIASHVSQRDLQMLFDTSTDGISKVACVDDTFKILYFNHKRAELTGTPASELASATYSELTQFHPEDLAQALEIFYYSLKNKTPFKISIRMKHEKGYYFPIILRGAFVSELYENKYPIFYMIYTKTNFDETNTEATEDRE